MGNKELKGSDNFNAVYIYILVASPVANFRNYEYKYQDPQLIPLLYIVLINPIAKISLRYFVQKSPSKTVLPNAIFVPFYFVLYASLLKSEIVGYMRPLLGNKWLCTTRGKSCSHNQCKRVPGKSELLATNPSKKLFFQEDPSLFFSACYWFRRRCFLRRTGKCLVSLSRRCGKWQRRKNLCRQRWSRLAVKNNKKIT